MAQIKVSEYVHSELTRIKEEDEHTSYDSAIRALIREHGEELP